MRHVHTTHVLRPKVYLFCSSIVHLHAYGVRVLMGVLLSLRMLKCMGKGVTPDFRRRQLMQSRMSASTSSNLFAPTILQPNRKHNLHMHTPTVTLNTVIIHNSILMS